MSPAPAPALPRNSAPFKLAEICKATGGASAGDPALAVRGVCTDTRNLTPGSLFVALRGERFDGHQFLERAREGGAIAALVDAGLPAVPGLTQIVVGDTLAALGQLARFHRQRFHIPVIGVTGSYGKTTTRALIAAALDATLNVLASSANYNNEIGVPLTLLQLEAGHQAAVIEMGMRGAGQIAALARIAEPTVGVITNIGPQHIELLGSEEAIAAAKAELLQALPPSGFAVLPGDDKNLAALRAAVPADVKTATFGSDPGADIRVGNIVTEPGGNIGFDVYANDDIASRVALPLPGAHNAVNAAAALAVARILGVPMPGAITALGAAEVPGSRMRVLRAHGYTVIDDAYNAGPDSMRAALAALRDFPASGRRIAVLGAMRELGEFTDAEHRKLGHEAAATADEIFGVGGETKCLIESAGAPEAHWFATADEAAGPIRATLREGDVILVKGSRGVGLEKVVNAIV